MSSEAVPQAGLRRLNQYGATAARTQCTASLKPTGTEFGPFMANKGVIHAGTRSRVVPRRSC